MIRILGMAICMLVLGGCSAVINGTAPAKDANVVYAAGAKQGFLWIWHPTLWKCSTAPGQAQDCKEIEVQE